MSALQVLAVPVAFLLGCLVGVTGLAVVVIVGLLRAAMKDAMAGQRAADGPRILFGVLRNKRAES